MYDLLLQPAQSEFLNSPSGLDGLFMVDLSLTGLSFRPIIVKRQNKETTIGYK